jgi:Skp family chaperone for outer membrane proteins
MNIVRSIAVAALCATPFLSAQDKQTPATASAVDAAAKSAAPAMPVVGVVNLIRAFEQYPKWIKLGIELKARSKAEEEKLKEMTKRIDELKASLELLDPESDERRVNALRIDLMRQEQQMTYKLIQERLDVEEARAYIQVYEDLEIAVAKVAKARGVSLVVRVHEITSAGDVAKLPAGSVQRRVRAFEAKQVWYADDALDLTPDLIKLLMVPLEDTKAGDAKPGDPKAGEKGAAATPTPAGQKSGG